MDKKRELKDRQAIALTYEPGTSAPAIVAAGRGYVPDYYRVRSII